MLDIALQSGVLNLAYLVLALVVGWFILLGLDFRIARGKSLFSQHFNKMADDPIALAIYLGLRFLGVCWLAASFTHG